MKIPYDPEKFGDAKPGDIIDVVGQAEVSEDGTVLNVLSIEDVEFEGEDEESPEATTEEDEEEMVESGDDIRSIIASGMKM